MKKKILALLLCVILIVVMGGCSGKGKNNSSSGDNIQDISKETSNKKEQVKMGRYMEYEGVLPDLRVGENIVSIINNKEGQVEVYINYNNKYFCYMLSGEDEWERQEISWINSIPELKNRGFVSSIEEGEDGLKYVLMSYSKDEKINWIMYKNMDDGKTVKKVNIKYLENGEDFLEQFKVLRNGNIVIDDEMRGTFKIYSGTDGEEIGNIKHVKRESVQLNLSVKDNKIITIDENGKSVIVYDVEKSQIERTLDYDLTKEGSVEFAMDEEETIYAADPRGIHRMQFNGSIWETVVDGSLCSMGIPGFFFRSMSVIKGEPEKFCVVSDDEKIFHYILDEKICAFPEKQINVYSLYENSIIRQAASVYQIKNPNIKINYTVAMGQNDLAEADLIRALNTEILAGSGADVLILDRLPVDSYIEKGVLADIGNIVAPLVENKELLENIAKACEIEGKTYQMPTSFMIPLISGNKEVLEVAGSLNDIASYVEKNPGIPFVKGMSSERLIENMLAINSNELFGDNKKLDEEKVISFLENLKIVAQNIDSANYKERPEKLEWEKFANQGPAVKLFESDMFGLVNNKCSGAYFRVASVMDLFFPVAIEEQYNYSYCVVNNMFVPIGSVGLNSKSKEQEAASDFIKFLFSREVQDTLGKYNDGFPVNEASLAKCMETLDTGFHIGEMSEDDKYNLKAASPSHEKRMEFLNVLKVVDNYIVIKGTIQNMVLEPSLKYLSGTMTLKQASNEILSKVNTYLAE